MIIKSLPLWSPAIYLSILLIQCLRVKAEIITLSGRTLRGILTGVNPEYTHQFGSPIPELSPIAGEIRTILRKGGKAS